jgi:hypothetical protein
MSQEFKPGDFLLFQVESGYGLLRILEIQRTEDDTIWHLAAYNEFFIDPESADEAIENNNLTVNLAHIALTNRAFFATQTAIMSNRKLTNQELEPLLEWKQSASPQVHDRSIRLMIGIR